jgi:lipoprotein-anchoring transpeptidase ErfK/SrfK
MWVTCFYGARVATVEMAMDQRVQDMFSASPRPLRGLVIVPYLTMMLAFPAAAQTNSDSETQGTGTVSVPAQPESERGPTSSNQVTPKTDSNSVTPGANSTTARPESKSVGTQRGSNPASKKVGSAIVINIDKTKQKMTIFLGGVKKYEWPVSTGKGGYSTPSGTYTATSMNEIWYSKQWDNAPMPHSIFFIKDGHAIHGSYEVKNLGKPVSHGCVRIAPENAATLYALVAKNGLENTQVMLTGVTPGGEFKVASPAGAGSRYRQAGFGWYEPGNNYYNQPQTRPSFFGRPFGGSYYNGPQGYYEPPTAYPALRGY